MNVYIRMVKFQIISDLHIEYNNDKIPDPLSLVKPCADILILAGDIGSLYKYEQLKIFISRLSEYFKLLLYIPGNHEYYTQKNYNKLYFNNLNERLNMLEKDIENLYILNTNSIQIEDVCIVGCTLWSNAETTIPKFIVRIYGMNNYMYSYKYNTDLNYIKKMIKYCSEKNLKLLVVTHHCPSYSLLKDVKKKDKYVSLYASNLDYLLDKNNVHTWISGHIHHNFDTFSKDGTRLVSNQRGKPKDNIKNYKKDFFIEI